MPLTLTDIEKELIINFCYSLQSSRGDHCMAQQAIKISVSWKEGCTCRPTHGRRDRLSSTEQKEKPGY